MIQGIFRKGVFVLGNICEGYILIPMCAETVQGIFGQVNEFFGNFWVGKQQFLHSYVILLRCGRSANSTKYCSLSPFSSRLVPRYCCNMHTSQSNQNQSMHTQYLQHYPSPDSSLYHNILPFNIQHPTLTSYYLCAYNLIIISFSSCLHLAYSVKWSFHVGEKCLGYEYDTIIHTHALTLPPAVFLFIPEACKQE